MIRTPAIRKEYKGRVVLDVPEMYFEEGKIYALIGANGSGKSTFAKNCGLAYQPQKPYAFRMSVKRNIMLATKKELGVLELMKALNLQDFATARADKLSGGETAKMALARTLSAGHKAIVLDEPTAAMDMEGSIASEKLIKKYAGTGRVVILITHSMRQAKRFADEIIFLKDGKVNNDPKEIYDFISYYE